MATQAKLLAEASASMLLFVAVISLKLELGQLKSHYIEILAPYIAQLSLNST